uniref:Nudix hydrolase domain-containing protein n=1 Tax=Timema bartmani TaxID=61472 RepID=A0A7R9ETV3_9NEOP|nr:unnamed protein product [Timema bartmani]
MLRCASSKGETRSVNGEVSLLYTVRSPDLKRNSGQVSFPGGLMDKTDKDLQETALRETFEELGIKKSSVQIWGHGWPHSDPIRAPGTRSQNQLRPLGARPVQRYRRDFLQTSTLEASHKLSSRGAASELLRGVCKTGFNSLCYQDCIHVCWRWRELENLVSAIRITDMAAGGETAGTREHRGSQVEASTTVHSH